MSLNEINTLAKSWLLITIYSKITFSQFEIINIFAIFVTNH